jgi:hypothetical protein
VVDGAEGHVISAQPLGFHQFFDLMVGPAQHLVRRQHLPGLFHGQVGLAHMESRRANDGSNVGVVV